MSLMPISGPGDAVIFDNPLEGYSVTHRVVSVTPGGIKTRGDNNSLGPTPDA